MFRGYSLIISKASSAFDAVTMASPTAWKDCVSLYPKPEEIVTALQDEGKQQIVKKKGGEVMRTRYAMMEKLAMKLYQGIMNHFNKPEGLTKNVSRGKQPLYQEIVLGRRHVDASELNPFFHECAKNGKVHTLGNDPINCGIDVALERFQAYINHQVHQKSTARTSNDGLRAA